MLKPLILLKSSRFGNAYDYIVATMLEEQPGMEHPNTREHSERYRSFEKRKSCCNVRLP